ncbi:hypothetical protein [Streptomyces tremellae]|uniref:Uncharacterized protein n=1 Tax=Streptomyces tremellae TaxID=1124239 RepID=A0ABP7EGP8_9ACTN
MNAALSLGGVTVALALLWLNLRPWLKGSRDPKALLPYASGAGLGSVATICTGGALGWGAAGIASLATRGGSTGVRGVTGVSGAATLPTGRMGALTQPGAVVACVLLVGVCVLFKASGKQDKRRLVGGFVTFAILGFLPGVAYLLHWWPDTLNWLGAKGQDLANTGNAR